MIFFFFLFSTSWFLSLSFLSFTASPSLIPYSYPIIPIIVPFALLIILNPFVNPIIPLCLSCKFYVLSSMNQDPS